MVYSVEAKKRLPALWVQNSYELAERKELEYKGDQAPTGSDTNMTVRDRRIYWIVILSSLLIFLNQSRMIQYFIRSFLIVVSIGIIYGSAGTWITVAIIVLMPYLVIQSFEILIYTGKKLKISDDDLQIDRIERNMKPIFNFVFFVSYAISRFISIILYIWNFIEFYVYRIFIYCKRRRTD